jgi:hypothetical protein
LTEPDGAALSTVFGRSGSSSLATLPVASVTTARRSYGPSATAVVVQLASYGAARSSEPIAAQAFIPAGENSNWTELTSVALVA